MEKFALSILATLLIGSIVIGGIGLYEAGAGRDDLRRLSGDIEVLQQTLDDAGARIGNLAEEVRRLEAAQLTAASLAVPVAAVAEEGKEGAPAPAAASTGTIQQVVHAALREERQIQDEERKKQREEMRTRMEERRKEMDALREGPYEGLNVKVNSLAKVLELNDQQKASYAAMTKAYQEKWDAGRKELDEARRQARAAAGEEGAPQQGRGRGGRGGGEAYQKLAQSLQEEYAAALPTVLTTAQMETYGQLSQQARSFQDTNYVAAPGEQNPFAGFGGPGGFGGQQGGQRGGNQRAGGGRGR